MTVQYDPQEMKLANEISATLHDEHSLPLHLQFVRRYTESFLRKKLEQALSMPASKVRKSRAALYVYLVTKDEKPTAVDDSDEPDNTGECPTCGRDYRGSRY